MTKRSPAAPAEMKMAELVRVSGTTRSTIHFYRNVGLLPPPVRRGPRLHVYGRVHLKRLGDIAALRAEGMALEEIQKRFARRVDESPRDLGTQRRKRNAERPVTSDGARDTQTDTRRAITVIAARAFVERGYDAVHVADIARAAGIGKAKFYEVFPSKADLFVDCLERLRLSVFDEAQRARLDDSLSFEDEGRLRASAVLERFEPYRMMTNLLAQAAYGADASLARRARTAMHRMITGAQPMFAKAVARGRCRAIDTELVSYMTWGALLALGDRLTMDDRFSPEEALVAYLDFVHGGVVAHPGDGSLTSS